MPILNFENRLFALETAHISYIFGLSRKRASSQTSTGVKKSPMWKIFSKIPVLFLWSTSVSRRF